MCRRRTSEILVSMSRAEIQGIEPTAVAPGGRLVVRGSGFAVRPGHVPRVTIGSEAARVVRGESPSVIPVIQPLRVHTYLNLKTAREFGVDLPPALILRADEVFR